MFGLTAKGFEITTSYEYDQQRVEYDAKFALFMCATNPAYHSKMLFEHVEPILVFPSDELVAKIALVVG